MRCFEKVVKIPKLCNFQTTVVARFIGL